jgi:hypothetical protein
MSATGSYRPRTIQVAVFKREQSPACAEVTLPLSSNTVTNVFGIDAQSADMANQPRRSELALDSLVYIECPSCHRPVAVLADRTRQERFVFCQNCLRGWNACLDHNDSPTFPSPLSTWRRVK